MQFNKLRLTGFKSFLDPSELLIEEGITGVVGPNGCGKSNIIESLRWVMGETSAKRMRGKEMDDVIFGGSANRPPRNIAEVTICLDNTDRTAPAAFNDQDDVEITRRIERGHGSSYRINGKEVRARDVQLFFADLTSGANSTAIVSQGRIGAIIGARPTERRTLLEEAAGIRGLHSRRHEAELRLRAAESNLERLEDVIGALEIQNRSLQKQARQANRYRRLSGHIRKNEAILLHLRWVEAGQSLAAAGKALSRVETEVEAHTKLAAGKAREQAAAAAVLPDLRQKEAEAAARLQRLMLAERELANEEARVSVSKQEVIARQQQISDDIARERELSEDADTALTRLKEEEARLENSSEEKNAAGKEMARALTQTRQEVQENDQQLNRLTEKIAGLEAQRSASMRQMENIAGRIQQLQERSEYLTQERTRLGQDIRALEDLENMAENIKAAEKALKLARAECEKLEKAALLTRQAEGEMREKKSRTEAAARQQLEILKEENRQKYQRLESITGEDLKKAENNLAGLQAEEKILAQLVDNSDLKNIDPVIDRLHVSAGYEAALGAALGEDLEASVNRMAPVRWQALPPLETVAPLPEEVENLARFVKAPDTLARRLEQIGVVKNTADGERLHKQLAPGQRLVSRNGGLWRWDGFLVTEGAPTSATTRLKQRNRLTEIRELIKSARKKVESDSLRAEKIRADSREEGARNLSRLESRLKAESEATQTSFANALEAAAQADEKRLQARNQQQEIFATLNKARQRQADLSSRAASAKSRVVALEENAARTTEDLAEARAQLKLFQQQIDALDDPVSARDRVTRMRANLARLRSAEIEQQSACDRMAREAEERQNRLQAIKSDAQSWNERLSGAKSRMQDLARRSKDANEEQRRLAARPAEIEAQRRQLLEAIGESQTRRNLAARTLAEAEQQQSELDRALRAAETRLAEAREERVRKQALCEQARQTADVIAERIEEKLGCYPKDVLAAGGVEKDAALPAKEEVSAKFDKLTQERENMGAVNLRAGLEAEELARQIDSMHQEQDDLRAAIARLRQGINALNREGRERLLQAFEEVNGHFQKLFVKLFGGGNAELTLSEAQDPLQAGLEIMASPPGKRMQVMSLLSGGEQALTALALLFAVFLTNPAPICVLDEVDAPLDDANVDRFCALLEDMAKEGNTRFLVVTHHRMTMARVDRLFGVTMAERGISQLVSVDLLQATAIRDAI